MRIRRPLAGCLAVVATAALTACGDVTERDFCRQYDQLVEQAGKLTEIDPRSAPAGTLRTEAGDFRVQLDELAAVSEGRLDFAVSTLRTALDDLRVAALDVDADSLAAARPLLEDSLDDVRQAWAVLRTSAAVQCGDG